MYQALYRKWRPLSFSDVTGQEHIVDVLKNEVITSRISHAYLFCGTRGTGKTTCAKILAKAVNCPNVKDGDPCNKCEMCKGIDSGAVTDVIEIDAASNNGVDNIREIRSEVLYTPSQAKFRVYIIDEVHMLSPGAFNALLKTLEEPPSHVIFILATTELHKLPATIISRCQRFDFKRIEKEDIVKRLLVVSKAEGISLLQDAAELIARLSDGSLRDALSILDQCASVQKNVTASDVASTAGLTNRDYIFDILSAVCQKDYNSALSTLYSISADNKDMAQVCSQIISAIRDIVMIKCVSEYERILLCAPNEKGMLENIASGISLEEALYAIDIAKETLDQFPKSINRTIDMEICLLKLCEPKAVDSLAAISARMSALEKKIVLGNFDAANKTKVNSKSTENGENKVQPKSEKEIKVDANFLVEVKESLPASLKSLISMVSAEVKDDKFVLTSQNNFALDMLKKPAVLQELEAAVAVACGRKLKIVISEEAKIEEKQEKEESPYDKLLKRASDSNLVKIL